MCFTGWSSGSVAVADAVAAGTGRGNPNELRKLSGKAVGICRLWNNGDDESGGQLEDL